MNANDLISRAEALDAIDRERKLLIERGQYGAEHIVVHHARRQIEELLAVGAAPVAHGKWVKVHGYITPGGDPVWACSECGKGVHVYGIEHGTYGLDIADGQWVSCPNCGAVMKEEQD